MNINKLTDEIIEKENQDNQEDSVCYDWQDPHADECFKRVKKADLAIMQNPGILVGFDQKNDEYLIAPPGHVLTVGYTGSGKDQVVGLNVGDVWTSFACKPSILIYDYKGDMRLRFQPIMEARGYRCVSFDTGRPGQSSSYNPFLSIYDAYQKGLELKNRLQSTEPFGCEVNGVSYKNEEQARRAACIEKKKSDTFIDEKINTFVTRAILDEPKNQNWIIGERQIGRAVIRVMLQDSEKPEITGMTREAFTLQNFISIISEAMRNSDDFIEWLERGSHLIDVKSSLALLNSQAKITRDSYLTGATMAFSQYGTGQIEALTTTEDSIHIKSIVEQDEPTAIFLTCEDGQEIANQLCMDFIDELVGELKKSAKKNPGCALKRDWLFLLNEFGNMPAMNSFAKKITTLRCYKIWMFMEVQSYEQLIKIYETTDAGTIVGNCDYTIFLGSSSYETKRKFSQEMGRMGSVNTSASIHSGQMQISKGATEVPVVRISDLEKLKIGQFYLQSSQKYWNLKSYITPFYERTDVGDEIYDISNDPFNDLSLEKTYYNIEEVLKRESEERRRQMMDKIASRRSSNMSFQEYLKKKRAQSEDANQQTDDNDDSDDDSDDDDTDDVEDFVDDLFEEAEDTDVHDEDLDANDDDDDDDGIVDYSKFFGGNVNTDEDSDSDSDEDPNGDSDEDSDGDSDEDSDGDSDEDSDGDSDDDSDADEDADEDSNDDADEDTPYSDEEIAIEDSRAALEYLCRDLKREAGDSDADADDTEDDDAVEYDERYADEDGDDESSELTFHAQELAAYVPEKLGCPDTTDAGQVVQLEFLIGTWMGNNGRKYDRERISRLNEYKIFPQSTVNYLKAAYMKSDLFFGATEKALKTYHLSIIADIFSADPEITKEKYLREIDRRIEFLEYYEMFSDRITEQFRLAKARVKRLNDADFQRLKEHFHSGS